MVCQAASQTRFRALKHENGIPGRSTIVVRVIACFQPLQNCQAKYFRQLLKPVTLYEGICLLLLKTIFSAEESQTCQQFSAWNSKDSNHPSLGVSDKPVDAPRKRFIIFDRSGNRTRFFVSPSFSRQNNTVAASEAPATSSVLCGKGASGVEEKWGENDLNDGEGEMLEDAEEIDALLCSDTDDDDDDDANDGTDSENDEVSSTRHTPLSTEDWENKGKSQVGIGNGDGLPKRRRLLDEGLVEGEGASYSSKDEKTVKIHEVMEVLGGIIPGLSSKDPLSIIEEAIVYLEGMKMKGKAVQVKKGGISLSS